VSNLDGATTLPYPTKGDGITSAWEGSVADLYVADAWASCSFVASGLNATDPEAADVANIVDDNIGGAALHAGWNRANPRQAHRGDGFHDSYLDSVLQKMEGVTCVHTPVVENPILQWYRIRTTDTCNYSPDLKMQKAAKLTPRAMMGPFTTDTMSNPAHQFQNSDSNFKMDAVIRQPGIDLCIATKLRQVAPGGMSGAALLLSSDDQLALLQRAQERAQQSVLGYARLVQLQQTPPDPWSTSSNGPFFTTLEAANWWLRTSNQPSSAVLLQPEFESAVQLLAATTKELAELYGRNASANVPWRQPLPSTAGVTAPSTIVLPITASRADRYWGRGGWIDRSMKLLYGDDPAPAAAGANKISYVTSDSISPQPMQVLHLARRFDALDISTTSGGNLVDVEATATRWYRSIEAGLRTSSCSQHDAAGACLVVTAADIPDPGGAGTQFDASLLHTQFSISYDDLQHAAAALGQEVIDASFTAVGGGSDPRLRGLTANPLGGAFDVVGQVSKVPGQDGNFTLHLSKGVDLRPRGLARVQALYASNAPAPYQGISMVFGTQGSWGFPEGVTGASTLDPESQMGAVPILAAAREYIYLGYGSSTSAMESKFSTLLDAISASIGTMAAVPVLWKDDLGNVLPPMTAVYTDQTVDTDGLELVGVADVGANPNSGAILLGAQAGVAVDIDGDTLASLHDRSVFRSAAGRVDSVSLQRPIRRTAYSAVAGGTTLGFHKPATDEYAYLALLRDVEPWRTLCPCSREVMRAVAAA
jgi:hypothetical protein